LAEVHMSPLYSTAVVLFMSATALLVVAAIRVIRTSRVLSRGTSVIATVVAADPGGAQQRLQMRYNLLSGDPMRFPCPPPLLRRVEIGDRLPMVFLPERDGQERVLDWRALWLRTLLLAALAVALAGLGGLALWAAPEVTTVGSVDATARTHHESSAAASDAPPHLS
jgi:hypothetical protein